jgi:hypothetical protein
MLKLWGKSFRCHCNDLLSKAGRPMVKVIPFDTTIGHPQRLGFMAGKISVPEDFDPMGSTEIAALFV